MPKSQIDEKPGDPFYVDPSADQQANVTPTPVPAPVDPGEERTDPVDQVFAMVEPKPVLDVRCVICGGSLQPRCESRPDWCGRCCPHSQCRPGLR